MKRYKLLKNLPTFNAGDEFELKDNGNLYFIDRDAQSKHWSSVVCAYCKQTLDRFPNILKEWFEEIEERPKSVYDLMEGDECWAVMVCELGYAVQQLEFGVLAKILRQTGSLFLTKEEAKKEIAHNKAREILKRDTKGFKVDPHSFLQQKWMVTWDALDQRLVANKLCRYIDSEICFSTKADVLDSIKAHPTEWKIYLGVEE